MGIYRKGIEMVEVDVLYNMLLVGYWEMFFGIIYLMRNGIE